VGTARLAVAADTFTDATGNGNTAGELLVPVDTAAPTIVVRTASPHDTPQTALRIGQTATVIFDLGERSDGFDASDIVVTNGTISPVTPADNTGRFFTVTFTPDAEITAWGKVEVAGKTYADKAGNPNLGGECLIRIDTLTPTVSITAVRDTLRAPVKAGEALGITFVVSEPTDSLTVDDLVFEGGRINVLTSATGQNGTVYTGSFTPLAGFNGTGRIALPAGRFTDVAGNPSAAAELSLTIDASLPAAPRLAHSKSTVTISGLETNATWEYSLDSGQTWQAGTGTTFGLPTLPGAEQNIELSYAVRRIQALQRDAAGNPSLPAVIATAVKVTPGASAFAIDDFGQTAFDTNKWLVDAGSFSLNNGRLTVADTTESVSLRKEAAQLNTRVAATIDAAGGQGIGLVSRATGSGLTANRYVGSITKTADGGFRASIDRIAKGVRTRLVETTVAKGSGKLVFDTHGSTLTLMLDSAIVATAFDTAPEAIRSAGASGVWMQGAGATLDGFRARTLTIP
jgi:hypothetical protein